METATEKNMEEEEVSVEVEGGFVLETKRRRRIKLSNDAPAMVVEEAGDVVAGIGEGTKLCNSDSSDTKLFLSEKKLENGNSVFTVILDDHQSVPVAGEKQDTNHIKVGNRPNSHIDSIENVVDEVVAATDPETQSHGQSGIAKIVMLDVSQLELEKVLEEKETHDMFCPNCHSCITKRVILRKRKRGIQEFQHGGVPKKLHVRLNIASADIVETSHDNEPDVFRCLSCFSFFIPKENEFNIFRIFRKREECVNVQVPTAQSSGQNNQTSPILTASEAANYTEKPNSNTEDAVFQPLDDVQITVSHQTLVETRRANEREVLKSIIYGGLIESITSLGVVSSAAGGETSTLNIIALGLANLIGGLFLILNDLSELRGRAVATEKDEEQGSRYWKVLGRKSNFGLHSTVAIISYILFGILPPAIYAFAFRESKQKEYKLIAVAASSIVCILLLAIGKAHVSQPKSYIKTSIYYFGLGFTVSGLSFVAGLMIYRFLQQLGLFEHDTPLPSPSRSPPSVVELLGVGSRLITSWASE